MWAQSGEHTMRLKKELSFALLFKLVLLGGIWWLCFAHPLTSSEKPQVLYQHIYK